MAYRGEPDPITVNAMKKVRNCRLLLGWSASDLEYHCEQFGAAQIPPIPSPLTRSRIAKLENGCAARLGVDEAFLLAGASGISLAEIISNSPSEELTVSPADPGTINKRAQQVGMRERVNSLERQVTDIINCLGELGVKGFPHVS
jgi:hypothetical protein